MFKTTREVRLNFNANYLCYALRALFWTLIIINYPLIISLIFFSLIFMLSFQIVAYLLVESFIKGSIQRLILQRIQNQGCPCMGARREYGVRISPLP